MTKKSRKILFAVCVFSALLALFFSVNRSFAATIDISLPKSASTLGTETELTQYLKNVFDIGMYFGFLAVFISLLFAGILYFIAPASPGALSLAKDRAMGAISGLLILLTLYLIITTINPQLRFFTMGKLEKLPEAEEPSGPSGAYFFGPPNCKDSSGGELKPDIISQTSLVDLGEFKNKINSISPKGYIVVAYALTNFQGKCQYINPNQPCTTMPSPFASSASIHVYEPKPEGDGVTFYRKSYFSGGYYKVKNKEIKDKKIYIERLDSLSFTDPSEIKADNPEGCTVEKEERDCVKYDAKGKCLDWKCPTLSGKDGRNLTSIKISGDYIVLLVYVGPKDTSAGPFTNCQEYPTPDDTNRTGPHQIKWDRIMNTRQGVPNWVIIIPITK